MERLLADAEKLTGIHYDIDNLSDVYSAIHVIQTELGVSGYSADELKEKLSSMSLTTEELGKVAADMGITSEEAYQRMMNGTLSASDAQVLLGTTAQEASQTLSGSFNTMKAAAEDFLGALTGESVTSTEEAFNNLIDSAMTFGENLLPMIETILQNVITMLPDIITRLFDAIVTVIIPAIGNLVLQLIPAVTQAIQDLANKLIEFANDPAAIDSAIQFIANFVTGLIQSIPQLILAIWELWLALQEALGSIALELIQKGWEWICNLAKGVWNGITGALASAWQGLKDSVSSVFNSIWGKITGVWESIKTTTQSVWEGIKSAITSPIEKAKEIIHNIVEKIKGFFDFNIELPHIKLPHFTISPSGWELGDLFEGVIPSLGIEWYAKGGVFNQPSVIGVGEAGSEAVVPLDKLWDKFDVMAERIVSSVNQIGGDIHLVTYMYPNGAKMDEQIFKSYRRGQLKYGI